MIQRRRSTAAQVLQSDKENSIPVWLPAQITKNRILQKPPTSTPFTTSSYIKPNSAAHPSQVPSHPVSPSQQTISQQISLTLLRPIVNQFPNSKANPLEAQLPSPHAFQPAPPSTSNVDKSFVRYPKQQKDFSKSPQIADLIYGNFAPLTTARQTRTISNNNTANINNSNNNNTNYTQYHRRSNSISNPLANSEINDLKQLKSFLLADEELEQQQEEKGKDIPIKQGQILLLPINQIDPQQKQSNHRLRNQSSVISFQDDHLTVAKVSSASTTHRSSHSRSSSTHNKSNQHNQHSRPTNKSETFSPTTEHSTQLFPSEKRNIEIPNNLNPLKLQFEPIEITSLNLINQSQQQQPPPSSSDSSSSSSIFSSEFPYVQLFPSSSQLKHQQQQQQQQQPQQVSEQNQLLLKRRAIATTNRQVQQVIHRSLDPLEANLFNHLSRHLLPKETNLEHHQKQNIAQQSANATGSTQITYKQNNDRMNFNKSIHEALIQFKALNIQPQISLSSGIILDTKFETKALPNSNRTSHQNQSFSQLQNQGKVYSKEKIPPILDPQIQQQQQLQQKCQNNSLLRNVSPREIPQISRLNNLNIHNQVPGQSQSMPLTHRRQLSYHYHLQPQQINSERFENRNSSTERPSSTHNKAFL